MRESGWLSGGILRVSQEVKKNKGLAGVSPGAEATTTALPAAKRLRCQNF